MENSSEIKKKSWKKFEKKLKKSKSIEEFISQSELLSLQWGEKLIKRAIKKIYLNEVKELLYEVKEKLDEISLYTIEDMLESDYLKPVWLRSYNTRHWPSSWKTNLLDIPLSRMKK